MDFENKTKLVENHLIEKGSITSLEAINLYVCTRLSSVIFRLKERGYKIVSIYEHEGKSRFVRYYLLTKN